MTIDARELQPAVHVSGVQAQGEAQPLQTFEASTHGTWWFWGLVVRSDPQVGGELSRVLAESGGDGVRALSIVTQRTFMDGLVSVITLGIYGRRTTFLRGTIVRPRAGIVSDIHSNRRGEESTLTEERRVRPNLVVLLIPSLSWPEALR